MHVIVDNYNDSNVKESWVMLHIVLEKIRKYSHKFCEKN